MLVLVVNTGSSTIKYQLLNMNQEEILISGLIEKIGGEAIVSHRKAGYNPMVATVHLTDHRSAFQYLMQLLKEEPRIDAIGHRMVHGGTRFTAPTLITKEVMDVVREYSEFAPLHNAANLQGVDACMQVFGVSIPQVAVFDTAFHRGLPDHAYLYPLPYRYYENYGIRKFGFHGISHRYASERCAEIMGRKKLRVITCHLGNGCSLAAVRNGRCIDTSMGMGPNEGVMMGTRSGSVDISALNYIAKHEGIDIDEMITVTNRESGLLGVSGISNDYRELCVSSDPRARLALQMQTYQIQKMIGAYMAAMNGVDAIVFTGGIGENVPQLRKAICDNLEYVGVKLDEDANCLSSDERRISTKASDVSVFVIPAREELVIARDTVSVKIGRAHV